MVGQFDTAAEAVIAHLVEEGHADTTIRETKSCFRDLEAHLEKKGVAYSRDAAIEWLGTMEDEWRHGKFKARRLALCRFEDAWANDSVTTARYVHDGSPPYARIPAWGKEVVDAMLPGASDVPGMKACCARFLLFAEL